MDADKFVKLHVIDSFETTCEMGTAEKQDYFISKDASSSYDQRYCLQPASNHGLQTETKK